MEQKIKGNSYLFNRVYTGSSKSFQLNSDLEGQTGTEQNIKKKFQLTVDRLRLSRE